MTRLTVDANMLAKLKNLEGLIEVCDESGRILGYFHPLSYLEGSPGPTLCSPFSNEELQQRRRQRTGRPLAEILNRLGQS